MRPFRIFLSAVIIGALSAACSTMTVRADYDSQVNFSSFNSFAMFERSGKERRGPQMSELVDRRIAASMKNELEAKGYLSARPEEADFLVTFHTAVRKRVVVNRGGYGYRWRYWRGGITTVNSYPEGTLVIDIIDRKNRNLVWRGVGQGAFSKMNPTDEKVQKKVTRVLRDFPPVR